MTVAAGTRLGPYEVLAPLGAGGMGEVFRARDTRLSREVAIKVLPAAVASDPERLKRFEKESRAASSLNHPSIVTIYDIGETDGVSWIAMELVEGKTLRELLAGGALPVKRCLPLATAVAEGLARAHEAGIVHRDLKPENVMVTREGLVKILDFGLAKLSSTGSGSGEGSQLPTMTGTTPGVIVGTVGYMSPEQASGEKLDFRSDQFSFGSLLYEMATGKRAFLKKTAIDTLGAILNAEPEPIAQLNPEVPGPLRWVAERCLAKDPEDRYASTKDLARELRTLADHITEATSAAGGLAALAPRRAFRPGWIATAAVSAALGVLAGRLLWNARTPVSARFQQVTFQKTVIDTASLAPDGQTIVYSSRRADGRLELFQTRPGSRGSHSLGIFGAKISSISPSGDMALIQEGNAGNTLAIAPLGGGEPRPLMTDVGWADWAPDGKTLAIVRGQGQKARLEFPAGTLIHEPAGGRIRVSPRGDRVAFQESVRRLAVVDRAKNVKVLTEDANEFTWSPDGEEVWFTRISNGSTHLFAATLSGRERLLHSLPGDFTLYDASRQGRVLFERDLEQWHVVGLFPGDEREHPYKWLDATMPADLSADGKTLLFMEKEPGWQHALSYVRKTDGSPAVPLSEGFCRSLSPDARWAICRAAFMTQSLDLVSTTGERRSVPSAGLEFKMISASDWLPDGKGIVFTANAHGRPSRIFLLEPIDNSTPVPITPEGVEMSFTKAVSPDGQYVVGIRDDVAALYPLKGGSAVPISGLQAGDRPFQWTPDGRSLYFQRGDDPGKIWLVDLSSGQKRLFKSFPLSDPALVGGDLFNYQITPDGQYCVRTYSGFLADLFVLDGLK